MPWLRSSTRQSSRFLIGRLQVRRLPGPLHGRAATGAVHRLENGWALGPWGFDSLPFRLGGMAELVRQRVANAQAGTTRSQVRVLLPPSVCPSSAFRCGRAVRRATVTREAQVRVLPPEPHRAPVVERGDDAGFSPRKLRVRVPPGVLQLAVGETVTPPASGAGDRRFDSCRPDCAVEERLSSRAS